MVCEAGYCIWTPQTYSTRGSSRSLGKKIVVLSEDQLLLGLVVTNLGKRGYEVASTSLARADRHHLTDLGAELLLLDVEPPGRDAVKAVQALGDLGWKGDIPVVVLCDEMPNGRRAGSRRGVQWVVKPFAVEVLLSKVKIALGDSRGFN